MALQGIKLWASTAKHIYAGLTEKSPEGQCSMPALPSGRRCTGPGPAQGTRHARGSHQSLFRTNGRGPTLRARRNVPSVEGAISRCGKTLAVDPPAACQRCRCATLPPP